MQGPKEVEGLSSIEQVAVGATHVVALVQHSTAADYEDQLDDALFAS